MEEFEQMRRLRLAADYFASPVWDLDDGGMVELAALPIDDALRERLQAWADRFDATMDPDDPLRSSFETPEAATAFAADGARLARELQAVLGADAVVEYAGA